MRVFAIAAIAALSLTGCAPVDNTADPNLARSGGASRPAGGKTKAKPKSDLRTVTYRIGGTASRGDLTYSTASGMEQRQGARIPWKKTFKVRRGEFTSLDVSAQNNGGGTITCEIDIDGAKVKAAKSSGQYAIASCDHALGL
jgi:hypothetical protein